MEQECQLALGQLRQAVIQKKTLRWWWWQRLNFVTKETIMLMLLNCDLAIAFTSEWYQEAKDQVQDFPPSRSLQRGCWEGPTLPHQLWCRPKIPLLASWNWPTPGQSRSKQPPGRSTGSFQGRIWPRSCSCWHQPNVTSGWPGRPGRVFAYNQTGIQPRPPPWCDLLSARNIAIYL